MKSESYSKIILASASPRRRELLEQIGLSFTVQVSEVEEKVTASEPGLVVEQLSAQKAEVVWKQYEEGTEDLLVIGADTVVALEERILGKPKTAREAEEMLAALSGKNHAVYTGVTCIYRKSGKCSRKTFHEKTLVHFYEMSREEIRTYVATGDCMDKAGAYGIQGFCARYIRGIDGDYNNVVGLPAGRLYQELKEGFWAE